MAALLAALYFLLVEVPRDRREAIAEVSHRLASRADVRREAVDVWMQELEADARNIAALPTAVTLSGPGSQGDRAHLADVIGREVRTHGMVAAGVLDAEFRVLAVSGPVSLDPIFLRSLGEAMRGGPRMFFGFDQHGSALLVSSFPIEPTERARATGVAFVAVSPERWLYRFLLLVDLPLASAQTSLVRQEGDDFIVVSPARPSGARFTTGLSIGPSGRPVLAERRQLQHGPWSIVVSVDSEEALAPFRAHVRSRAILVAMALLAIGAAVWGLRKSRAASIAAAEARSDARMHLVLDQASDAIVFHGMRGEILEVNRAAAAMYGATREELLQMNVRDLRADGSDTESRKIKALAAQRGELVWEAIHRRRDGSAFPVEVGTRSVTLGPETGFVSSVRDISERKAGEAAMRLATEIMANMHDGVMLVRARDRVIIQTNPKFDSLFGYARGELLGKRPEILNAPGPRDPKEVTDEIIAALDASGSYSGEIRNVRKDGTELWTQQSTSTFQDPEHGHVWVSVKRDITADKRAEKELQELHKRTAEALALLDSFYRHAPVGIGFVDRDFRYVRVNDEMAALNGRSVEEHVGRAVAEVLPGLWPRLEPVLRGALAGESTLGMEVTGADRDRPGESRHFLASYFPVRDGKTILGVGSVVLDITDRKRTEDALRSSEEKFERIFRLSPDAVFITDLETGALLEVNEGFARRSGIPREEAIGRSTIDLGLWVDDSDRIRYLERLRTHGFVRDFEARHRIRDGHEFWGSTSAEIVSLGGSEAALITTRDVTERKAAEERIQMLLQVLDQSPASVVITDPEGSIEFVNRTFENSTGYGADEVRGKNPRVLKSGLVPAEVYEELWATVTSGRVWQGELVNKKKDGSLFTEQASMAAVADSTGKTTHYVAVKLDVTDRKRAEEELEKTKSQLLQAQKMEAVGRLAGGVAHDFNNLLTVIHGYAELLRGALPAAKEGVGFVDEILRASDRAADLTRQLLAFSRRQVLEPRVLQLDAELTQMEGMLRRLIGEDIEVVVQVHPPIGSVLADQGQIEQVILNLAVNSRDAMPHGGRLTLALEETEAKPSPTSGVPPPGRYLSLEVSDTGTGIDPETLSHIFEPFFTTKEAGKGTGLGLATVYGIVKQSNGFIFVRSEPGKGTTFQILLPRHEERAEPIVERVSGGFTALPATILLVEDEEAVRRLAQIILEEAGYRVLAASGSSKAIEISDGPEAVIDLLLTDVVMPGLSGPELACRLAAARPGMKVVYSSGYIADELGRHGVLDAGVRFIPKPFTKASLLRHVREALEEF